VGQTLVERSWEDGGQHAMQCNAVPRSGVEAYFEPRREWWLWMLRRRLEGVTCACWRGGWAPWWRVEVDWKP
jgi:hypothetical protein